MGMVSILLQPIGRCFAMKKLMVTVMGVVLAGTAVTAMASKSDREQLSQCLAKKLAPSSKASSAAALVTH